ncbi:isopentenyl-diphosphate Delta-isomerase [soil metagenome]
MRDLVILVDENDKEVGTMDKMEAHLQGILHRAFSVIIRNDKQEILIQQRALHKYHSGGLWANSCCSHPFPGESNLEGAKRRLSEEMGIQAVLSHSGSFLYRCEFDNGLTEFEFDHVFNGHSNDDPKINPEEVNAYQWIDLASLMADMKQHPERYTFWFHELLIKGFLNS